MPGILKRLQAHPKYDSVLHWGKLVTITGSAQITVQAIGFLCGIMVVRWLSPGNYALYTLANTVLGTMSVLADSGVASGVMSQGGKVWKEPDKLGSVVATGLDLRQKFSFVSLLVAIPVLLYLLLHHEADWATAGLIVVSLIPAFISALSGTLLLIVPRLHQNIVAIQKIQVSMNILRLALLVLFLFFLKWHWVYVVILCAGLPQVWANLRLRKISYKYATPHQPPDPVVKKEILGIVRRRMPGAIWYCMASQITIWVLSVQGDTTAVGQAGALGRLAVAFSVFNIILTTLVVPRFARLPQVTTNIVRKFFTIQAGLVVVGVGAVLGAWLFAGPILWTLGNDYRNLRLELILTAAAASVNLCTGLAYSLNSARGIVLHPAISIPVEMGILAILLFTLPLDTLAGVITLNIFTAASTYLVYVTGFIVHQVNHRKDPKPA